MALDGMTFEVALRRFKTSVKNSMRYADHCARLSLQQFADHGNLNQAQLFLEAMPQNYVRRAAFTKWLVMHAPITMEQGKLIKDKNRPDHVNLEAAFKAPFWEQNPDREPLFFTPVDFLDAVEKTIKRHEAGKTLKPKDDQARDTVAMLKSMVAEIRLGIEQNTASNDEDNEADSEAVEEAA